MKRAILALSIIVAASGASAEETKPDSGALAPPPTTVKIEAKPLATNLPTRFGGKKLVWEEEYTRVDALQLTVTGVAIGIAVASNVFKPRATHWASTTGFDNSVRDTFRFGSYTGRSRARDASDVTLGVMSAFPFIVDSLMIAYWYRGSAEVARQMFLIDAEAMSIAAAVQGSVTWIAGRQRPYVRDCGSSSLPVASDDCQTSGQARSFFSGHTSQAFVSAALICSHHLNLNLFDSAADGITCGLAMTAATATGMFRIMGDMHYASDVLMGAAVGTLIGLGIPWLHHYRRSGEKQVVEMKIVPTFGGLAAIGGF